MTTPDDGREHWYPQIVPGGRAVLFTASEPAPDSGDVMLLDLDTGEQGTRGADALRAMDAEGARSDERLDPLRRH